MYLPNHRVPRRQSALGFLVGERIVFDTRIQSDTRSKTETVSMSSYSKHECPGFWTLQ